MSVKPLQAGPLRLAVGLAVICAFAGCSKKEEAATPQGPAAATTSAAPAAAAPTEAVSAKVAAMSAEQLRDAARKAQSEQRLYAPAGDNAVEYYLALRDKAPNDPVVASALTDLMPYTLIATEQSISREDFAEAQRLYALMEKADPNAPALPRLKATIASQQQLAAQRAEQQKAQADADAKKAELEKQRLADQQKAQQQAAAQLAAQQAAAAQAAEQQRLADQQAAAQRAAQQRAAQPASPPATQPSTPAPAASTELRAISTPAPKYPPDAFRSGTSGEVQVEFTVGPDGVVTSARVVRANPPRVFDREALAAVKRWRFQPVGAPVTTRRTISFNPGQ
ncbi:MAG: energy transducer TonB [Lysobacteraceae bacterium]